MQGSRHGISRQAHSPMVPCCSRQWHSGEGVHPSMQASGKLSWGFSQCLVLSHQEPRILNILQHVVHFSITRIYPDPNANSTPTGKHLSRVLCSHTAVFEKQPAKRHSPAVQPNTAKIWPWVGIAATGLSSSLLKTFRFYM